MNSVEDAIKEAGLPPNLVDAIAIKISGAPFPTESSRRKARAAILVCQSYMGSSGAEAMREAALLSLPGGQICDPQEVADVIRALPRPLITGEALDPEEFPVEAASDTRAWIKMEDAPPEFKDGRYVLIWLGAPYSRWEKARWYEPWGIWIPGDDPANPETDEMFGTGANVPTHIREILPPPGC